MMKNPIQGYLNTLNQGYSPFRKNTGAPPAKVNSSFKYFESAFSKKTMMKGENQFRSYRDFTEMGWKRFVETLSTGFIYALRYY